jgi:hypothetical protein
MRDSNAHAIVPSLKKGHICTHKLFQLSTFKLKAINRDTHTEAHGIDMYRCRDTGVLSDTHLETHIDKQTQ